RQRRRAGRSPTSSAPRFGAWSCLSARSVERVRAGFSLVQRGQRIGGARPANNETLVRCRSVVGLWSTMPPRAPAASMRPRQEGRPTGMEYKEWLAVASDVGVRVGVRVLGAIVLWIVGRAVINFVGRIIARSLASQHLDPTLGRYIASAVSIAL